MNSDSEWRTTGACGFEAALIATAWSENAAKNSVSARRKWRQLVTAINLTTRRKRNSAPDVCRVA
jgi:hypothetical protein